MTHSTSTLALIAVIITAGCSAPTDQDSDAGARRSTVVAPNAVIQGLVLGYTIAVDDTWATEPVAGTAVDYMAYSLGAGDSAGVSGPVLGKVTADAQGRFTIGGIASGWYALRFTPPSASPYEGGVRKINTDEHQGVATFSLLRP